MRVRDCTATEKLAVKCTLDGRRVTVRVAAAVRGPLAIHPSTGNDVPPWTVTHIASGYAVLHLAHEAEAEEFVREILALDWDFTDAGAAPQGTQAAVAFLSRRFRR